MATAVVAPSVRTSTIDLWGKALEGLTIDHTLDLTKTDRRTTLQEILGLVLTAEEQCKNKRWKWKNRKGEQIILRDVFTKMTVWIDKFKGVGDVIAQYDPGHAALPWAAVRFILQAVMNDIQTNAAILEGLEMVMNLIAKYETIEILYLSSPSSVKPALEENILKLYVTIFNYLIRAHQYFNQKTIARIANSIFQLENSTTEFLVNVRVAATTAEQYLPLVSEELQQNTRKCVIELGTKFCSLNISDLEATLKSYDMPILRMCSQLSAIEDHLRAEERVMIFEWLTTDDYQSHHRSKYKTLLPGSGAWLLQKPEFIEWQGASSSSILWLHGIPGSGKSMLLAHVIEHLKALGSEVANPAPIAFFYCARNANEPERADPAHLMRTILEQLCSIDEDTPIRESVVKAYKTKKKEFRGKTPGLLTLDDAVVLILELLQSNPAIIIIDGLDECDPSLRQDLLHSLTTIINESSSLVKVLVSSRDDQDLVHHLSSMPNIYIRASENTSDILNFVETRVNEAILGRKILRGNVSDDLKEQIIQSLIQKAEGMFRLTSLHIGTLCDPRQIKTRSNVLSLLATLPRDLKQSYDMVLAQINESQEPNPAIANRIFKWLLCARTPLRAGTFSLAVSSDDGTGDLCSKSEILDLCVNLVIFDEETKRFRFVHLSVQEYLLHTDHYSAEQCNMQLAKQSLFWLMSPHCDSYNQSLVRGTSELSKLPSYRNESLAKDSIQDTQDLIVHVDQHWTAYVHEAGLVRHEASIKQLLFDFLLPTNGCVKNFEMWTERKNYFGSSFPKSEHFWVNLGAPATPLLVALACDFGEVVATILGNPQALWEEIQAGASLYHHAPSCAQIAAELYNFQVLQYLIDQSMNLVQKETSASGAAFLSVPIQDKHRSARRRRGVTVFVENHIYADNSSNQDYWYNVIDTIIFQADSAERDKVLSMIFGSLGGILATPNYVQCVMNTSSYGYSHIAYLLSSLFHHNPNFGVTDDMLFTCQNTQYNLARRDTPLHHEEYEKKRWFIRQLLIYHHSVHVSKLLLQLSVFHGDLIFDVMYEMISWKSEVMKIKLEYDSEVVDFLMIYGNPSMLRALKTLPKLNIHNRSISFPYDIISQLRQRRESSFDNKPNILYSISLGKPITRLTIGWREVATLLDSNDGTTMLQFVLECQPEITPVALRLILEFSGENGSAVKKALFEGREVEMMEQIVSSAAESVKRAESFLQSLVDEKSKRDLGSQDET